MTPITPQRIYIPTLKDKPSDFTWLFTMANQAASSTVDLCFDFSKCESLWPNAIALLGGIARLVESQGKKIIFDWDSLKNEPLKKIIFQNEFAKIFGFHSQTPLQEAIPYREDRIQDKDRTQHMNSIMDYLTEFWIGKGWVHVTNALRDAIVGKMWEIYSNAFEHSSGKIGVFSCGEHIRDDLILTVVDFGYGIPKKVRNFLSAEDARAEKLESASCLKWAFKRGNSTSKESIARGLGLDLLKEFVQMNHGKLEVYSNDGYVLIDDKGINFENCNVSFEGTVVHITLRCDEKLYLFLNEINPEFNAKRST